MERGRENLGEARATKMRKWDAGLVFVSNFEIFKIFLFFLKKKKKKVKMKWPFPRRKGPGRGRQDGPCLSLLVLNMSPRISSYFNRVSILSFSPTCLSSDHEIFFTSDF
jgi:hypothetical protein